MVVDTRGGDVAYDAGLVMAGQGMEATDWRGGMQMSSEMQDVVVEAAQGHNVQVHASEIGMAGSTGIALAAAGGAVRVGSSGWGEDVQVKTAGGVLMAHTLQLDKAGMVSSDAWRGLLARSDDDVDVEEVERRKRYERALAKFPYQGDLGRAVRAQDREAIRLINRMRTAFETREDTAALEDEARALVVRKRAETPSVKAPSLRRREQEEKVRKAALLKQRERAAASAKAQAEAELAAKREAERQEALREAQAREAEEQRRAALMAEAQARREAAAREEAERRGAAERTAEAERLASERDAEALALAAERDAEASAEAARAAAAQRAVHAAKARTRRPTSS